MRYNHFFLLIFIFAFSLLTSCGGSDSENLDTSSMADVSEALPESNRWMKELQSKDLTFKVNASTGESETQVSILLEKDGSVQTVTNFLWNRLTRIAKANLNGDDYDEIILIGNNPNNVNRENIVIFQVDYNTQEGLWVLSTVLLPQVPGNLLDGATGNEWFAVKPPYIERTVEIGSGFGGGKKVILFKVNKEGEAKLHSIDGELVQEIAF
jgi:hypothetical protein